MLSVQTGVLTTFSRKEIEKAPLETEASFIKEPDVSAKAAAFYKRGYHPDRSGDCFVVVKEGWLGDGSVAGNHGSVYEQDSRIPLGFFGNNIQLGIESESVRADDIAPTILDLLGMKDGSAMTGKSVRDKL